MPRHVNISSWLEDLEKNSDLSAEEAINIVADRYEALALKMWTKNRYSVDVTAEDRDNRLDKDLDTAYNIREGRVTSIAVLQEIESLLTGSKSRISE